MVLAIQIRSAEPGEKRLLLANAVALPFVLVRIIFSALGTFGNNPNFRAVGGTSAYPNYLLGMSVIMEVIVVIIFEAVGLTLQKQLKRPQQTGTPLGSRGQQQV